MKHFLSVVCAAVIGLAANAQVYFISNNIRYSIADYKATSVSVVKGDWAFTYSGEIDIPETVVSTAPSYYNIVYPVKTVDSYAFMQSAITSLSFPESVKAANPAVCYECKQLKELNLHGSMVIFPMAFYGCTALEELILPDGIRFGGGGANINGTVRTEGAFANCGLKKVTVKSPTPPITAEGTFAGSYNAILYVPAGTEEDYRMATEWRNFTDIRVSSASIDTVVAPENEVAVEVDGLTIKLSEEVFVRVYEIDGECVFSGQTDNVTVPAPGVYVLHAGGHTYKFMLH